MAHSTKRIAIIGSNSLEHQRCKQVLNEGGYSADIIPVEDFVQATNYACVLIDSNQILSKQWQEVRSKIPVIALLDDVSTPRNQLYDQGVIDYVLKPIYAIELLYRIYTVIEYAHTGAEGVDLVKVDGEIVFEEGPNNNREVALVENTCAWLEQRLAEKHQLDDIAIAVGTNRSKLAALFKQHFGQGVFEWLTDRRMVKARSLLQCSDLSIQEVGFEVGYVNCGHFSTAYKRKFKLTPSQQRKQKRS